MSGVVVWAYLNDRHQWSPYEPSVSSEIEKVFSAGTQQKVDLGAISPALSCYEVDVVNMQQIRKYTGSVRRLQRSVYPPGSPFSQGFIWEFEGDTPSHWVVYDVETLELIEGAHSGLTQPGATWLLDLQQSPLRLPYVIDFRQSTQTRTDTGKVRKIRRRALTQPYTAAPMVTNSTPAGGAPAAAAAQTLGTLPSSSSSSSLSSSSSSASQGSTGTPAWHVQQGKLKSVGKRHRHQPYTAKSGSGQGSQGTNQVQGQSVVSQTGYTAPSSQQVQHQLQIQQLQQGIQQLQTPQTQIYNGPGPMTRKRLQQNPSQAMGQSLLVPTLQQQQISSALLSAVQQQPQQQQQQQPHSLFSLSAHNTMMTNHQPPPAPGQGMHLGFQYQQPQSIGLISSSSSSLPPPLAHQHPQVFGTSSSSSSSSTSNSQPPESLPAVTKITISKARKTKPKTGMEVLGRYMHHIHKDLDENDCAICCDKLSEASSYGEGKPDAHDAVQLTQCGHQFHKLCLLEMYNANHKDDSVQCPSCKTIYGEKTGICPSGYMQWQVVHGLTLPGYERYGTICVTYHISPGIQGPEHPNPGERYSTRGFPRQGFIPDCDQGRKVLKLLMEAFRRRLMFTIGTSHTTGETNTVTWNEIHHKTEPHGNHSGHGYPDPKYLDNVLLELAAHGVTEDCLPFLTF